MAKNIASENIFAGLQGTPEVVSHPNTHAAAPATMQKDSKETVHLQEGTAVCAAARAQRKPYSTYAACGYTVFEKTCCESSTARWREC